MHDYVEPAEPVISTGTSVPRLRVGLYSFTPRASGRVNRDFSQVTPDGQIYCYEAFRTGRTAGGLNLGQPPGIVLLALADPYTLRIEVQTDRAVCGEPAGWAFTSAATAFER
ncbi:MAG: hypothetical protein FJ029_15100 [Actinobacteria bacterium]|nr:hypothetical protein [Actinomycetota bacterium]